MRQMLRLLIAMLAVVAAPLTAHELRPSTVELRELEDGAFVLDWNVTLTAGSAPVLAERLEAVIPQVCTVDGDPVQQVRSATLMGRASLTCTAPLPGSQFGVSELLGKSDGIARYIPRDGPAQSFRLTADAPAATILAEPDAMRVVRDYFVIGAEHILFGWDHLLFVIALVLLVRTPWPVVKAATAFTVAHSITLVATVLGYSGLPSRPVEALIALSIVYLAVEIVLMLRAPDRPTLTRRYPWAIAFGFGLVHGFGFAGALADIGLPQTQLARALFAFNVGVEAGQLLVVAATLAVLTALRRAPDIAQSNAIKFATYAIGVTASFWLIERLIA